MLFRSCSVSQSRYGYPDTKWKLDLKKIEELRGMQKDILSSYSRMVKPSGYLMYATCSILPIENEQQVERFLSEQPTGRWKKISSLNIDPSQGQGDGFFAALLQRIDM